MISFTEWLTNENIDIDLMAMFLDKLEENPNIYILNEFLTLVKRQFMRRKKQFQGEYARLDYYGPRFADLIRITNLCLDWMISYSNAATKSNKMVDQLITAGRNAVKLIQQELDLQPELNNLKLYKSLIKGVTEVLTEIKNFNELMTNRAISLFKQILNQ